MQHDEIQAEGHGIDAPPPAPPFVDERCEFIVWKKKRRCRKRVVPGLRRCGVHRDDCVADDDERVPCPLDPEHTVSKKRLEFHLTVCSKRRDTSFIEQQPFYKKAVNLSVLTRGTSAEPVTPLTSPEAVEEWSDRIHAAYAKAVAEVLGECADADALLQVSMVEEATHTGHAEKHEVQNQALVQLMLKQGLVSGKDGVVIEYGCGRGGLAVAVQDAEPTARCVLLDREARKVKLENKQEHRERTSLRLRLDISDFDLSEFLHIGLTEEMLPKAADFTTDVLGAGTGERLEEVWRAVLALREPVWPPRRLLACAKHLCGRASDITLRSLQGRGAIPATVCIATCCHHCCDAETYVNMAFLERIQCCSAAEFPQFISMAGWGVAGVRVESDRRRIGLMAKRILDLGRVAWLRESLGFADACLTTYISKDVTPENFAIVGSSFR